MYQSFLIADHIVRVADGTLARLLHGFEYDSERTSAPDVYLQEPICSVYRTSPMAQHGVESLSASHPIDRVLSLTRDASAVLLANEAFDRVTVRGRTDTALSELMLLAVYSRLSCYRTVFVHGALVDVPGVGGLMFTGPSGVGKTTQAVMWQMLRGAEVINGDKVFLSIRPECPGEVLAYGSPWRGSSPFCVNKRVPLRAIVSLKRQDEKYIRALSDIEALTTYVPSVFMPHWDVRLTECVMDTLSEMLPLVPVYEMSCNPDAAAVDMVARLLDGKA